MLRLDVNEGERIEVTWVSAVNAPRVQGLSLRIRNPEIKGQKGYAGQLRRGDLESPSFRIWSDEGKPSHTFDVIKGKAGGGVRVSNVWLMPSGA